MTYAGCRYVLLERYPFSVIYCLLPGENSNEVTIYVVAIAHAKRHPGYWKSRLRK